MIDSNKLDYLSVPMLACTLEFELQLKGHGISFVRACTYRDHETQAMLYAMGRTSPGRVVTWAKAGQSLHNDTQDGQPASNATDYYPLLHGKLCGDLTSVELATWARFGQLATACGLDWGGDWSKGRRDLPHVQLSKSAYVKLLAKTLGAPYPDHNA
jgi:peptidoglycan L-alanyl-D-glutamate endopeptidase CwlK